jgi:hypothetical protein
MKTRLVILVSVLTLTLVGQVFAQGSTPQPGATPAGSPTSSFGPEPTVPVVTPVATSSTGYVEGAPVVVTGWGAGAQGAFHAILAAILMLGGIQCVILFWIFIRR